MTVLAVLERELRVRARSRANHWGRFAVGALGLLIGLPPLVWSGPAFTTAAIGRGAFDGLVSGAFLLCCAACLLAADAISSERREGTLGLLLVTRVRAFEVLLGKFASSGLASMLGLMAFLPALMLPILAGGVTGGEAARKGLVLFDTLFLSLSVGLWASARGCERFRTARAAVLVLAGIVLVPVVLGWLVSSSRLGLVSPLGGIFQAADSTYKTSPSLYWLSLGLVQVVGWTLLFGAMARLRGWPEGERRTQLSRSVRSRRELATGGTLLPGGSDGVSMPLQEPSATTRKCGYCGHQNDGEALYCQQCGTDLRPQPIPEAPRPSTYSTLADARTPLHWLLRRRHSVRGLLWIAAALGFVRMVFFGWGGRFLGVTPGSFLGVSYAFGFAALAISGSIFVWVASRFFVEARRTGELELLVTTPLGAEAIVSTQWSILKGLVVGPVMLMLAPLCLQGLLVFGPSGWSQPDVWRYYFAASSLCSAVNTVLRVGALLWVGLWFGLRAGTQGRAILWTLMLVEVPPYVLGLGLSLLYRSLFMGTSTWSGPWVFGLLLPHIVSFVFLIWLMRLARRQLSKEIAGAEPLSLQQLIADARSRLRAVIRTLRQWPPVQRSS